jgi:hypothetical protein
VQHADNKNDVGPVTEMAIVNTFTKLIFGDEASSARETLIIQAFRSVDANVLRDNPREMGEYLRSLGVREMIQLVSRVRQQINDSVAVPAAKQGQEVPVTQSTPVRPERGRH